MKKKIFVIGVNPENGQCLAFDAESPELRADSYTSHAEAIGELVRQNQDRYGIEVIEVTRS